MDLSTLATAQNKLDADLAAVITSFLEANEEVKLTGVNIDLWSGEGVKVTSNVTATIDGARISRSTEKV